MARDYAKMSAGLDRNRKIRKAGRNGRDVFLYVLRKVADANTSGWVRAEDLDDLEWVSDELMCSVTDVTEGVTRCIAADLLQRDGDRYIVVGWDDSWGARKPLDGAERTARWRSKQKPAKSLDVTNGDAVTSRDDERHNVTDGDGSDDGDESDVVEESRVEESRSARHARTPRSRKSEPTESELSDVTRVIAHLNALTGSKYTVDTHKPRLLARLREGYSAEDLEAVARYCAVKLGWKSDAKMSRFLRPATLYGPEKIRDYIDEARQHASRSMHVVRAPVATAQQAQIETDWYAPPPPIGGFHSEEPS